MAVRVAERVDPFFGAGLLFIAAGASESGIETPGAKAIQKGLRL